MVYRALGNSHSSCHALFACHLLFVSNLLSASREVKDFLLSRAWEKNLSNWCKKKSHDSGSQNSYFLPVYDYWLLSVLEKGTKWKTRRERSIVQIHALSRERVSWSFFPKSLESSESERDEIWRAPLNVIYPAGMFMNIKFYIFHQVMTHFPPFPEWNSLKSNFPHENSIFVYFENSLISLSKHVISF